MEIDSRLARSTADAWLDRRAERLDADRTDELWTHRDTLVERLMVASRDGWTVERLAAEHLYELA